MEDELTLKELILGVKEYFLYFTQKWFLFLFVGISFALAFGLYAYFTPLTYNAPLTFIFSDGKDSGLGLGGVLGKIGIGDDEEGSNASKILELVKTREILKHVLFDSVTVEGNSQLVADHLIEIYDLHERWIDNSALRDFRFGDGAPEEDDTYGNFALKQLVYLIIGTSSNDGLLSTSIDEKSGIFNFNVGTLKPELSAFMVVSIYDHLIDFYVDVVTAPKRKTFKQLSIRSDSVVRVLKTTEAKLAKERDRNSRVYLNSDDLKVERLNREVLMLTSLYAEVVKNKETASFLLSNESPSFRIIDRPLFPLLVSGGNLIQGVVIGGGVGVLFVAIFLFFRKLIKDALS